MSDIFISYASLDRPRVKPLVDALQQHGWSVWWDRTILPGSTWDDVIERALADARCVIVLWSRASIQSDWVRAEADEAKRRGILVPVLIDDVNVPLEFKRIQTCNLTTWAGVLPNAEFQELVEAVSEVLSNRRDGTLAGQHSGVIPTESKVASEEERRRRGRRRIGVAISVLVLVGILAYVARIAWHPTIRPAVNAKPLASVTSETKPGEPAIIFDGNWKADVNYGDLWEPLNQTHHETFRFTAVGDEVLGKASLLGFPRPIRDGKVLGRNISFVTKYELTDGSSGENRYRGIISGDRIQFTFQDSNDGGAIAFTATRVKP